MWKVLIQIMKCKIHFCTKRLTWDDQKAALSSVILLYPHSLAPFPEETCCRVSYLVQMSTSHLFALPFSCSH